jgi:hypothetical protein
MQKNNVPPRYSADKKYFLFLGLWVPTSGSKEIKQDDYACLETLKF